ncbi:hypothetical protein DICSQDRAFT_171792 [Dichomitus squalens LYAD-421 SS1]|uniref:Uncharacterized protein n=1 Tax=Dichomitus squalens (strain LYAD-421) TaxID=732165 RepID=R7SX94_DICSQ|nr:uncharacterized protein DICSQDRAFT_171792 [Dichomitus squalens LYAD-421 SS1]EJF59607.1 hypothetical protein DICSQDRAFT_171792 [Dichomitus squalens LYAD-421 SS1]
MTAHPQSLRQPLVTVLFQPRVTPAAHLSTPADPRGPDVPAPLGAESKRSDLLTPPSTFQTRSSAGLLGALSGSHSGEQVQGVVNGSKNSNSSPPPFATLALL